MATVQPIIHYDDEEDIKLILKKRTQQIPAGPYKYFNSNGEDRLIKKLHSGKEVYPVPRLAYNRDDFEGNIIEVEVRSQTRLARPDDVARNKKMMFDTARQSLEKAVDDLDELYLKLNRHTMRTERIKHLRK